MYCTNCGNKVDEDALFCTNCGVKLSDNLQKKYCCSCGTKFEDDAIFCVKCGRKIQKDESEHEFKTSKSIKSVVTDVEINNTENLKVQDSKPVEKVPVLEYKNISFNGRHFVYLDDSSKVFCPKCHNKADIYSTRCSFCNENFCEQPSTKSQEKPIIFQKTSEKLFENRKLDEYEEEDNAKFIIGISVGVIIVIINLVIFISLMTGKL